jgi:hypothetical protein
MTTHRIETNQKEGLDMTKLTDMIISAIIKRGILCEGRNIDTDIDIPGEEGKPGINIRITAEHLTLRIENGNKEGA